MNAADYVVWRNGLAATGSGTSSLATVPEPAAWLLALTILTTLPLGTRR